MKRINNFLENLKYSPYNISKNAVLLRPELDAHKGLGFKLEDWHGRLRIMLWWVNVVVIYNHDN